MFQNNPFIYYVTWKLGLQPALTQTTKNERSCLGRYSQGKKVLVEIGVWHGVNTRTFRSSMHPTGMLYGIDPFPTGRFGRSWEKRIAIKETGLVSNGTVHFLELLSEDAVVEFDRLEVKPIDFIFIDGDHSYEGVQKDWLLWAGKIALGGVVALHDSNSYKGREIDEMGSARFTRDVVLKDERFRLQETCDSLTVMERVA